MANQNSDPSVKAILISRNHAYSRSATITILAWLAISVATAISCQMAPAQDAKAYSAMEMADKYRVEFAPYNADEDELAAYKKDNRSAERNQRESIGKIKAILYNNGNFSDPVVREYFEGYEFPSMTTLDNRVLSKLGEKRTKFIKDYLNTNVTGNARSEMINLTIDATKKICINDTLHPAVRLNAVYLLGMLDQVPPVRSPVQLPVPSQAAFGSLKQILESNDAKAFPPYIKVAALAGIQRHVEIDRLVGGQIPAGDKQQLLQKAYAFVEEPKNDVLNYWLKRRGMQLIGLIGSPQSLDKVIAVLDSEDAGFWLRFDALETIGQLNLSNDGSEKNLDASIAITEFLGSSLERESKAIQAAVDKLVYDQLLFQDVDLVETGTNYESNQAAATGTDPNEGMDSGGGPGGSSGKFGGGGAGMGAGAGAGAGGPPGGAPGGGFGGGFGGGATASVSPSGPSLELPVFQLNIIRRRIKALAFIGSQILGGDTGTDGMNKLLDADGQAFIAKVVKGLNDTLAESNVGIKDLDARKSRTIADEISEEDQLSVTQQLIDLCASSGKTLIGFANDQKGEPEVDPAAAEPDAVVPETPAAKTN